MAVQLGCCEGENTVCFGMRSEKLGMMDWELW